MTVNRPVSKIHSKYLEGWTVCRTNSADSSLSSYPQIFARPNILLTVSKPRSYGMPNCGAS